jgi:hypothetical protein
MPEEVEETKEPLVDFLDVADIFIWLRNLFGNG